MKKTAIEEALNNLIPQKEKEKPQTVKTSLKTKKGYGKIVSFYFYKKNVEDLNKLHNIYNNKLSNEQKHSKSDIIKSLIEKELKRIKGVKNTP